MRSRNGRAAPEPDSGGQRPALRARDPRTWSRAVGSGGHSGARERDSGGEPLELHPREPGVEAAAGVERVVAPFLYDAAMVHDDAPVAGADSPEAGGDDAGRAA